MSKGYKKSLRELIVKIRTGFGTESSVYLRILHYIFEISRLISKFFIERRIHVRSAALTYYTTFALVPISAFVMGIAKGFGFDSYVKDALYYRFPSHVEMANMLFEMIQRYLDHAKGGAFIGIGVGMLLWSIYRMFNQIERAFNDIWGIEIKRPIKYRIPNYIAIAFFIPIFILFTSAVSFYFKYAIQYFGGTFLITPSLKIILAVLPYVVSWLTFTMLFWFIPNTQVQFRYAAFSGLIFSVAFMIFKWVYVYFQSWMTTYNAVYGALAAIPFLLMFLQVTWTMILLGCAFTFTSQCLKRFAHEDDVRKISHKYFEFACLVVTKICVDRFKAKQEYVTLQELTEEEDMPYRMAKACVDKLCRAGILDKVEISYGKFGYRPKPDLSELTCCSFYLALDKEGTPPEKFHLHKTAKYAYIWRYVEESRKRVKNAQSPLIVDLDRMYEEEKYSN